MPQILLDIDNEAHAAMLLELLGALHFVRAARPVPPSPQPADETASEADFFSLAGIWTGRDVTQATLRDRAWPVRPR